MDPTTMQLVITGIVIIVTNIVTSRVTISWLRADLLKHEKRIDNFVEVTGNTTEVLRKDIRRLFTRTDNMMTQSDIAKLVSQCLSPVQEDTKEMRNSIISLSSNVNTMSIAFARMDERMKARDIRRAGYLGNDEDLA